MTTCSNCQQTLAWCNCPERQREGTGVAVAKTARRSGGVWLVKIVCEHGMVGASFDPRKRLLVKDAESAIEALIRELPHPRCSCQQALIQHRRERRAAKTALLAAKKLREDRQQPSEGDGGESSSSLSGAVTARSRAIVKKGGKQCQPKAT